MINIVKCTNCDTILTEEDDDGCRMCHAIERELNRFAEDRWQQNHQTWEEFWVECEKIKGNL
jgi:hypothetical protein